MFIRIDPFDPLFFRDGKPFSMGEDTWANCIFPPSPSVIYGALRTVYFSNHIVELDHATTEQDVTKNLVIKGIYLLDNSNTILLPLPLDFVQKKDLEESQENEVELLSLVELQLKSSCVTSYVLKGEEGVEAVTDGLISGDSLGKYLAFTGDKISTIKLSSRVLTEPKIGIGLNKQTRIADESKLYRVGMKRLKDISLLIEFEGLAIPDRGLLKFGGENKAAYYNEINGLAINWNLQDGNKDEKSEYFKLYLATPAVFTQGWLPSWIDSKSLEGKCQNTKFRLLTASVGKYHSLGGFDIVKKKPKPMWKAVPAGSVYYFKIIDGDFKDILNIFNGKSISDEYPEQGFGISFVGKISK